MIMKPGIFTDISPADYFADPCSEPSFTQSLAKVLLSKSPWHAAERHPRINKSFEPDEPTKFDVANVAHLILLGRGKKIAVVDFDDWRTKAAKEAREASASAGNIAVLRHQYDQAGEMAASALQQLTVRYGFRNLFADGDSEVVLAWQEGGVWLRTMVDWLSSDRRTVIDYKSTKASAAPIAIPMKMAADGWCIQAAMHERGLDALHPPSVGRRAYLYICQECDPPYALSVSRIGKAPRTMGRKQLDRAIEDWRRCLLAGKWEGYETGGILEPEYPGHLEARWLERELAAEEQSPMVTEFV